MSNSKSSVCRPLRVPSLIYRRPCRPKCISYQARKPFSAFDLIPILFCPLPHCSGLKRMYTSVMAVLKRLCEARGMDSAEMIVALKHAHRWHVEVA